jgi:hypothetical protein
MKIMKILSLLFNDSLLKIFSVNLVPLVRTISQALYNVMLFYKFDFFF